MTRAYHRGEEVVEGVLHARLAVADHHRGLAEHLVLLLDVEGVPPVRLHLVELGALRLHLLAVHRQLLLDAGHDPGLDLKRAKRLLVIRHPSSATPRRDERGDVERAHVCRGRSPHRDGLGALMHSTSQKCRLFDDEALLL